MLLFVLCLLAASAPAPAATGGTPAARPRAARPGASEAGLRRRVVAYWNARAAANLQQSYAFYAPAFRAKYTADEFARNFRRLNRFAPEFVRIESLSIDAERGRAMVKVRLRVRIAEFDNEPIESVTEDVWLFESGAWWKEGEPLIPNV